jgi:hypothetical protein
VSPPDELGSYYYDRAQDRKWDAENLKRETEIIQIGIETSKLDRDIEAAERAAERSQRRTKLRHQITQQRDWVKRYFEECQHFSKDACKIWADRTSGITEDDVTDVRLLREDFVTAADNYQHDLKSIVETISGESAQEGQEAPQSGGLSPRISLRSREWRPPAPFLEMIRSDWPKRIQELRRQILACEHLRDDARQEWLGELPLTDLTHPAISISWELWELSQANSLRRKIEEESKSAQRAADLICASLESLQMFTESYAAI